MTLRVLVVDDEGPARRKVLAHLAGEPGAEVVGEAANGLEAVDAIRRLSPDLVFLDVQMPGLNGFEVIEAIGPEAMPVVVFVTAYDEFALQAFDVAAADYLLKPIREDRFRQAFARARSRLDERAAQAERLARLVAGALPGARRLTRLVVRKGERLLFVDLADVVRLLADGNYVNVETPSGTYQLRDTMARLETRLDPDRFARIHRSEIVNVDWVKEVQPWFHGDSVVVLKNGLTTRLSRRYQDRLLPR
jgi:two-component system LytT family response regulator